MTRRRGSSERLWLNLFPVSNLSSLSCNYRIGDVVGLPPGDMQPQQLEQLRLRMNYDLRQPVALLGVGDSPRVAVPASVRPTDREYQLSPYVATVRFHDDVTPLDFGALGHGGLSLAKNFLEFALRKPLMDSADMWGRGRRWYWKIPEKTTDGVDVYRGFVWHIVPQSGQLYVAIDSVVKYVAAAPVTADSWDAEGLRFRHCLYRMGDDWFDIQLMRVLDSTIAEQRFIPSGAAAVDVYSYTKRACKASSAPWIDSLDPESRAMIFRYPGNHVERFGALELCWLRLRTDERAVAKLHRLAIACPRDRMQTAVRVARTAFEGAALEGRAIEIATSPRSVGRRSFRLPRLRFGQDVTLDMDGQRLTDYPRQRAELLTSRDAGPLDRSPFGPQYIVVPQSLPRRINEDFCRRFVAAMKKFSHDDGYSAEVVVYDDRQARTLHQHVRALQEGLRRGGANTGYGLLVLPASAPKDLHHFVKVELQPTLQFKCASAESIRRYYDRHGNVRSDRAGRYRAYIDNCAIPTLLVNRRWLWALDERTHHDLHIGIDVLHGQAGLTFVYEGGQRIYFNHYRGARPERLSAQQIRTAIVDDVRKHGERGSARPQSILIHRDGRLFTSERRGIREAVRALQGHGALPLDVRVGFAEIHKDTMQHYRLVAGRSLTDLRPARVGSYYVLDDSSGIVCTTGWPFPTPGTPKPLYVEVSGDVPITHAMEDIFWFSQLGFSAPAAATRLPVMLKLADDFLEAVAADYDADAALYDADQPELAQRGA